MNKVVNGQVIDITGTPEETAILAEWADNSPGTGAKWIADQLTALLALRAQAKAVFADLNGDIQAQAKAIRGLALLVLDEVNILRAASVPPLPPRTADQLKTAIRNKIDTGDTDS